MLKYLYLDWLVKNREDALNPLHLMQAFDLSKSKAQEIIQEWLKRREVLKPALKQESE